MYKVMIVEDEPRIREAIAQYLPWNDWGYEVSGTAGNGQTALDQIRIKKPDVLLADIRMPVMDGLALIRELRISNPDIITIILSGHDDFEYARQAMAQGAYAYLLKTEIRTRLGEVMQRVLSDLDEKARETISRTQAEKALFCQAIIKTLVNQKANETAEALRLSIDHNYYFLVLIRIYGENEIDSAASINHSVSDMQNYLEIRLVDTACPNIILSIKPFELILLFYCQNMPETVLSILQARLNHIVYEAVKQPFAKKIKLIVVDTKAVAGSSQLFHLYKQASQKALVHLPDSQIAVFHADEDTIEMSEQLMNQVLDLEIRFFEAIQIADDQQALNLLEQWIRTWTCVRFIHVPAYRQRCTWLMIELHRVVRIAVPSTDNYHDFLNQMENPNAMSNWLRIHVTRLLMRRREGNTDMTLRVESIKQYVKDHCLEKINLQEIASRMHMNASYLSTCYKKATGMSFSEYYTSLRMEKAAELLRKGRTVASVSTMLGYADTKSFRQMFKKFYGTTPGEVTTER
ncbi:MAG: response regulator [Bacillota bacterium]|nr:response regulator [Bacillota bacterium]